MSARKRRRVNPFAITIGGLLMLVALAAVYFGLAEPLHLWPHQLVPTGAE
jgi:hypothetical protein